MSDVGELIKNYKKYGWREFGRRWKKGIMRITPEQLLRSEIVGFTGSIIATILAGLIFIFLYDNLWAISIIMFFNVIIQGSSLLSKYQQLSAMKAMRSQMESIQDIMGGQQNGIR